MRFLSLTASCCILILTTITAHAEENSANLQLQYREAIPENGDLKPLRAKFLAQAEKDCEAAAIAMGRHCRINSINFNWNRSYRGDPEGKFLSAGVSASLVLDDTKPQ
jgi:hypothetical protein